MTDLRGMEADVFQTAAKAFEDYQGGYVELVAGTDPRLDPEGLNSDDDFDTWIGGSYNSRTGRVLLNQDFGRGDFLIAAAHESQHLPTGANQLAHTSIFAQTEYRAFQGLGPDLQIKAPRFFWRLRDRGFSVKLPPPIGR